MTVADKVREMTDEELLDFLFLDMCNMCLNSGEELCGQYHVCRDGVLSCLKSEWNDEPMYLQE